MGKMCGILALLTQTPLLTDTQKWHVVIMINGFSNKFRFHQYQKIEILSSSF